MGFFSNWAANISEYKRLQQELSELLAPSGINFMHLHPEITKFLVAIARREGAPAAIEKLNSIIERVATSYPGLSQEHAQNKVVQMVTAANQMLG